MKEVTRMKIDWLKVAGIGGSVLGIAATIISEYASDKKLDNKVAEKVAEALSEKDK